MQPENAASTKKSWNLSALIVEKRPFDGLERMQGTPCDQKTLNQAQVVAVKERKEEKTYEKVMETKTKKVMDLTDLKDSLQALREVKMLLQEFPTLLEATRRCREVQTKQEKALIVLSALMGD
ncbi:hypothetical protein AVEN_268872-1 [Araneus ventricosus]|uniref:Uncharacterized protein n=1 Tax=Araneus ventricosus TaxID=182803 RepID=A0A4Y2EYJ8_ARAVE|nr:hypothetical protein AVEN_268872-1 [Araneus ventricosus]